MNQRKQITINIQYKDDLPCDVYGASFPQDGGMYTVVINGTMKPINQLATFLHEMTHIYRGDHEKTGADVDQLESENRQMLINALSIIRNR